MTSPPYLDVARAALCEDGRTDLAEALSYTARGKVVFPERFASDAEAMLAFHRVRQLLAAYAGMESLCFDCWMSSRHSPVRPLKCEHDAWWPGR